jgi:hypothetical protein
MRKKRKRWRFGLMSLMIMLVFSASIVYAQSSSENFRVIASGFGMGGGKGTSPNYKATHTTGQTSSTGASQSENFGNVGGIQPSTLDEPPAWAPRIRTAADEIAFGYAWVGMSIDQVLTIYNDGFSHLEISEIVSDDPQFVSTPTAVRVNGLSSADVMVTFTPTAEGVFEATLTIVSNDPDEGVCYVTLYGEGVTSCPGGELGDVTASGDINILDVLAVINHIIAVQLLSEDELCRADCNLDGRINVLDALGIANVILGIGHCPPDGSDKEAPSPALVSAEPVSKGQEGDFELPISVESESDIAGLQIRLSYDALTCEPGQPVLSDRGAGMSVTSHATDGELIIVIYSAEGKTIPGNIGDILTVPFATKGSEPSADEAVRFQEVVLAASCTETVPAMVQPIDLKAVLMPTAYRLEQNYPNPFNPKTDIRYQIPDSRSPIHTTLKVFNIIGQEVRRLVDEPQEAGFYIVTWDGRDAFGREVASGVYFYRLTAGDFTSTRRMVLMK